MVMTHPASYPHSLLGANAMFCQRNRRDGGDLEPRRCLAPCHQPIRLRACMLAAIFVFSACERPYVQYRTDVCVRQAQANAIVIGILIGDCGNPALPRKGTLRSLLAVLKHSITSDTDAASASISRVALDDPWGRPYWFLIEQGEVVVWSAGPNARNEHRAGDDLSARSSLPPWVSEKFGQPHPASSQEAGTRESRPR